VARSREDPGIVIGTTEEVGFVDWPSWSNAVLLGSDRKDQNADIVKSDGSTFDLKSVPRQTIVEK
jgi:hypothetical protein